MDNRGPAELTGTPWDEPAYGLVETLSNSGRIRGS